MKDVINLIKECEEAIMNGQTEYAIRILLDSGIVDESYRNTLLLQANSLSRLNQYKMRRTVDSKDLEIQFNKISDTLVQILSDVRQKYTRTEKSIVL